MKFMRKPLLTKKAPETNASRRGVPLPQSGKGSSKSTADSSKKSARPSSQSRAPKYTQIGSRGLESNNEKDPLDFNI